MEAALALMHLVYVSSAIRKYNDAELDEILNSSVRHNQQQNITGMLLYADGNFIQVLEGESEAVEETFGRITKDPRHQSIYVLLREAIHTRSFNRWAMGFRRVNKSDTDKLPGYSQIFEKGFDAFKFFGQEGMALTMLLTFAATNRA